MKKTTRLAVTLCATALFTPLSHAQNLYVGSNSSGVTTNFTSGTNAYGNTIVGVNAGDSNNTLNVYNAGTLLTNSDSLTVGGSGSGNSLVISNGGTVAADNLLNLGQSAGSDSNSIVVTGTGSSLAVGNAFIGTADGVGNTGNTLEVSAGGSLTSVNVTLRGSSNSVLVTGSNSTWTNSGQFSVGEGVQSYSTGNSLVISNGGKVVSGSMAYSDDFKIGIDPGDNQNSVTITGAGSMLSNGGDLTVGYYGSSNSLVISDGGTVANRDGFIGRLSSGVNFAATHNTALVTGAGSLWTNSGTLTVGGSPLSGATGGTLTVASGGTVAAVGGITIAAQAGDIGTLNIGRFGTNDAAGTIIAPTIAFGAGTGVINFNQSNSTTVSAAISGNGTVNQLGSGTTTLSASNTYTGATTVSAGKLVVDGSISLSTVTVQGGTLSGSGTVGGLIVNTGGTISPGNSPGALNVAGNVVWNAGGNYNWQIAGVTGTAGTVSTWDLVSATGVLDLTALSIGSKFNINLWSLSSTSPADVNGAVPGFDNTQNYTWKIASAAGGITNFSSSYFNLNTGATNGTGGFANALNGGSFSLAQSGNDLNLVFTSASAPIPEPGTWAAMAIFAGGAAYAGWRRRQRAKVA
jgi:T5SS/PEP-CTERM-associated repeat protein